MRRDGRGVCEMARAIGCSKSTVSREIKRNSCERLDRASTAQRRYAERRKACRRRRVLDDERMFSLVRDKFLEEQWSPEQIEGRLARIEREQPRQRHDHLPRHKRRSLRRLHRRPPMSAASPGIGRATRLPAKPARLPADARRPQKRLPCRRQAPPQDRQVHPRQDAEGPRRPAARIRHARPRQGVRRPCPGHGRDRSRVLLRAAPPPLAARHRERERQRPPAGVLPEGRVAGAHEREARAGGVR